MKITIPGDPIPKARARTTKKGFAYDPQWEQKKRVSKFLEEYIKEFYEKTENRIEGSFLAHEEAFEVNWYFYMPIPKSLSQIKRNACKWGFIEHTTKPDRSNLEKFYEDCANGILWKDDSQITKGKIVKRYCDDDKPRTEIEMKAIKPFSETISDIVSLFSPEEISTIFYDFSKITMTPDGINQLAFFLSKIADLHTNKFSKIAKNYPGYWKRMESSKSIDGINTL